MTEFKLEHLEVGLRVRMKDPQGMPYEAHAGLVGTIAEVPAGSGSRYVAIYLPRYYQRDPERGETGWVAAKSWLHHASDIGAILANKCAICEETWCPKGDYLCRHCRLLTEPSSESSCTG